MPSANVKVTMFRTDSEYYVANTPPYISNVKASTAGGQETGLFFFSHAVTNPDGARTSKRLPGTFHPPP